jgi:hypothetical protein
MSRILFITTVFFFLPDRVEYLLGVGDPASHLILLGVEDVRECFVGGLAFFGGEHHSLLLSLEQDLAVVKKVNLEQLVAQPEHYCMTGLQPLLHVHELLEWLVDQF